jgi:hypothetical protein
MLRYSFVVVAGLWVASTSGAATWADGLFDELSKDFGSVPRGPTLTHHFGVVNKTSQPVNISSVRVSCGCVSASALKTFLNPGEETSILARMDTTRFTGPKTVTIYVQFDRPNFEEVRLWVQANGRNDLTLVPDTLAFGAVKRGTTPTATVQVTFYGNREYGIVEARGESNYIMPTVTEVRRLDHEVVYNLTVQLRVDTPVGKWYTDVWLKTNIVGMTQIRVPLTVEVESPITVSPAVVQMGVVRAHEETERRIIVRGVKPFLITQVKGVDDSFQARVSSPMAREVHVLTIKVKPGTAGAFTRVLHVVTDMKVDNEIEFRVQGQATDP